MRKTHWVRTGEKLRTACGRFLKQKNLWVASFPEEIDCKRCVKAFYKWKQSQ